MLNRKLIVERHHPTLRALDPLSPFSVGNGEFAFTADITGLQTFPDFYEDGTPLHTLSNWGWHSFPNPHGFSIEDALHNYEVGGRNVPYASNSPHGGAYSEAAQWLRANPHRLDLGRVGLILRHPNGEMAAPESLSDIWQTLDLWRGCLNSRFSLDGEAVRVETVCHPRLDLIHVRIESALLPLGRIGVRLTFPYALGEWKRACDWANSGAHRTTMERGANRADFARVLDGDRYFVRLEWLGHAHVEVIGPHEFELWGGAENVLEFVVAFSPAPPEPLPDIESVADAAEEHWEEFWARGGALDLSQSFDLRWMELERRVVLSQYVTAVNCSGSVPPQETGLVCNSWFGKFHLEMHPWHALHFACWNRPDLLERSLGWYQSILPIALENARRQGYRGARWPKMVAADGRDSPSSVGVFLIWQQPHPLLFAELCFQARPDDANWNNYREMVFATADFMASYARWEEDHERYVLGPALIPAQESYGEWRATNLNPTLELAYWHWGLGVAQNWRERCGLKRDAHWDHVRDHLAMPPVRDGIYEAIETAPHLVRRDHPSMLGALGFLPPTPLVDADIMRATLHSVLNSWDWPSTWGWDYPLIAMTAARLGLSEIAFDALLFDSPKNGYLPNGHNYQEPRLPLYLPGNGGLLAAIALLVAGSSPQKEGRYEASGWIVCWEELRALR